MDGLIIKLPLRGAIKMVLNSPRPCHWAELIFGLQPIYENENELRAVSPTYFNPMQRVGENLRAASPRRCHWAELIFGLQPIYENENANELRAVSPTYFNPMQRVGNIKQY